MTVALVVLVTAVPVLATAAPLLGLAMAAAVLALVLCWWPVAPGRSWRSPPPAALPPAATLQAPSTPPGRPIPRPPMPQALRRAARLVGATRSDRARRRLEQALADDLPETAELLAVAAAAGCNVRLALDAVRRARDGPAVEVIGAVLADVDVGGRRLADALARAPGVHGEAIRPLTALLADAERYGTPLGPALERVGDDLRQRRRRRAEERARQLPVRLLLPLVLCILPAFALLTVAPLLVSGVHALSDHQPDQPHP